MCLLLSSCFKPIFNKDISQVKNVDKSSIIPDTESFLEADLNKDNVIDLNESKAFYIKEQKKESEAPFWSFMIIMGAVLLCCFITPLFLKIKHFFTGKS